MKSLIVCLAVLSSSIFGAVPIVIKPAGGPMQPPDVVVSAMLNRTLDYRVCGEPARDKFGNILRSQAVLNAFKRIHPCPITGLSTGVCPGWQINHTIPLAKGGCDAVYNLDWMPEQIKTCTDPWCRDRWERLYNGEPHGVIKFP